MARIINVEKSQYISDVTKIHLQNKVGQYSKYLDKNPIFVTWYHINSAMSRNDVGTGGVHSDTGPNSPIRFNRINGLPTYNLPELKPEIDYDDKGMDIDLEINDAVLLPNTIKPTIGDYIIISLPGMLDLGFRVNNFRYNTFQSNDFYTYDADFKFADPDGHAKLASQVVEEYDTIFDNIGTDDKCFIQTTELPKLKDIAKLIIELRKNYYDTFFDHNTGNFLCKSNDSEAPIGHILYDKYLEKFINDSEIYYMENDEFTIHPTCADMPTNLDQVFRRTIYHAVLYKNLDYLAKAIYNMPSKVLKVNSVLNIFRYNISSANLVILDSRIDDSEGTLQTGEIIIYTPYSILDRLSGDSTDSNPVDYVEEILISYFNNKNVDIKRKELIELSLRSDSYAFRMMPLMIYILMTYYRSYFKREEL